MMKISFETLFSPLSTLYVFIRDKSAIMFSFFVFFLVIYYSISFRFLLMTLQPSDVSLSHTRLISNFQLNPTYFTWVMGLPLVVWRLHMVTTLLMMSIWYYFAFSWVIELTEMTKQSLAFFVLFLFKRRV